MKIRAIEAEAFRGFCERRRFEFADADVLLLYGPNGHGKTSFFDAIEWALTGQIARYEEAGEKKQQTPYYKNLFAQERPQVVVEFDGMTVVRTAHEVNKRQEITLAVHIGEETLSGDEAEAFLQERLVNSNWRGLVTPARGLGLTHFLSQERMDRFVRGVRGDDRYNAISLLFGTEAFLQYKEMFREAQKALEKELSDTEARLTEAQKTVETYRDTQTLPPEEIESAMRTLQTFGVENGLPIEPLMRRSWAEFQAMVHEQYRELREQMYVLDGRPEDFATAEEAAEEHQRLQRLAWDVRDLFERSEQRGNFDELILFLERQELHDLLETVQKLHAAKKECVQRASRLDQATSELKKWELAYQETIALHNQYRSLLSEVKRLAQAQPALEACPACGTDGINSQHLLAHVESEQKKIHPELPALEQALREAEQEWSTCMSHIRAVDELYLRQAADVRSLIESLDREAEAALHAAEGLRIQEQLQAIAHVLSLLDLLTVSDHPESIRDKLAAAEEHVCALTTLRDQLQADLLIAKEVVQAVPVAVEDLNERVMAQLFDTIQFVFARINSHPLFQWLDFSTNKSYGSYRLLLSVLTGEHEADPSIIFSSAQINSIALAFFLAMAMQQQWSPLQVIGMDDPVQSMDELNVLALIDLIRQLCDSDSFDKQVIISTHDESFYRMMQRKFRFLRVGVIEYYGYVKRGPIVKQIPPTAPLSMPELAPKLLELQ
ncbi:MAG: AAA family ATPase [Tumebacillaceae bacterium]